MTKQTEAIKLALEALEQIARITGARWALENSYAGHLEAITALREALSEQPAQPQEPVAVELVGVEEAIKEGDGFWKPCTGCYETNEGYPPTGAFFSTVFKCHIGHGCSECGGLGAIWDDTDYEAMADHMMRDDAAPQPAQQQEPVGCQYAQDVAMPEYRCIGRCQYDTSPPAQRTWVGLTDDEIYSVLENLQVMHHRPPPTDSRVIFALAIEAKLKEKNT